MRAIGGNVEDWCRWLLLTWTCVALMKGCEGSIRVVEEEGLQVVENGTVDAVVLDCPFTMDPNDHKGLVIKWFHSKQQNPVYQWIPSNPTPQAIGILKGRVDLEYVASDDLHHRHRALKILNPTTDLTGQYSCVISSFNDEKIYKQKLVIYSEPQEVRVWTEQRDDKHVTVLCEVSHVYPQPQLHLHQHSSAIDSVVLGGGKVTSSQGSYNLTLEHMVEEDSLQGMTTFECQVTIPDTQVQVLGSTQYQPMTAGGSDEHSAIAVLGGIALLVLWRM